MFRYPVSSEVEAFPLPGSSHIRHVSLATKHRDKRSEV